MRKEGSATSVPPKGFGPDDLAADGRRTGETLMIWRVSRQKERPAARLACLHGRPKQCQCRGGFRAWGGAIAAMFRAFGPTAKLLSEPPVMRLLVALVRAKGEILSRDDLIESCRVGVIAGEDAINRCIRLLRKAAEACGDAFTIETIPCVGYRLKTADIHSAGPGITSRHTRTGRYPPRVGGRPALKIAAPACRSRTGGARGRHRYSQAQTIAGGFVAIGDYDKASDWYDRAYDHHQNFFVNGRFTRRRDMSSRTPGHMPERPVIHGSKVQPSPAPAEEKKTCWPVDRRPAEECRNRPCETQFALWLCAGSSLTRAARNLRAFAGSRE